ncbi:MAG: 3-hydroxyacyl-CoA dehydrogenase NAD-binding domain-containing protein [Syntrophales bacterium]|nr:3-hydroxyacyl-CoA dehydrogenase NAD-binding domain-containing protein [Syntrophales bacterium]MDP3096390.1 3-hydroxyacyl-CoA dehydrogenase NAD-binding domain-containing protein [Syntrophales bacterium]
MIRKLCVIGAGTMGAGIAQVAAENGINVVIRDVETAFVERGIGTIRNFIGKKLEKGKISQDVHDQIVGRVRGTTSPEEGFAGVDMVVEAVFESLELKQKIFAEADRLCKPSVILSSNTSTMSITKIASATSHPERVIGTHFFSPVPVMRLVEVIRGEKTTEAVVSSAVEFCKTIGKTAILCKDVPGFIVNRFLCLLYNEAANQIHQGMATAQDIDLGLKLGSNHPMGPVEIMDLAGVDVVYNALKALHEMTGEERYRPSPLFAEMVRENRLGRKTGRGFYTYEA